MKRILLVYVLMAAMLCTCLLSCANEEKLPQLPCTLYKKEDHFYIAVDYGSLEQEAYRLDVPEEIDGLPVARIRGKGFSGITQLVILYVPGSVKQIDESAFLGCTSLQKVTIECGTETIGGAAFADCTALTKVTLPNTLTYMGWCIFQGCTSLTEITFEGTRAEWDALEKEEAFWTNSDQDDLPWYYGSAIKVVHCTDGDIAVGE
ncbi:MAG: leucine-rich repeat domain-containing protein [Clostridia bacterium]|nr:leucine-rich repeat domain-containing protein [Clostridia bacterium]